jgi:hypothetical protein
VSFEATISADKELLALVGALANESARTVAFKLLFARNVLGSVSPGEPVPSESIEELLFELSHSLSLRSARKVLLDSGLARGKGSDDPAMEVPATIALGNVFGEEKEEFGEIEIPVARFLELLRLDRGEGQARQSAPVAAAECVAALDATSSWGAELAKRVLELDLPGVPVFWDCGESGHTPLNQDPGTLTTSDTVLLILERVRRGMRAPILGSDECASCIGLVNKLLGLQREGGWNRGAFCVPEWDDDFLGSFDKEKPELGTCPTVDATGGAVMALCAILHADFRGVMEGQDYESFAQRARDAVERGVDFLLRSQFSEGPWPVYRYEDDRYVLPARDLSSRYAIEAIADAVRGKWIGEALAQRARDATACYARYVYSTAQDADGECAWLPNFIKADARDREKLQATCSIWLSLEAALLAWPEFAEEFAPLRNKAVQFIDRLWEPDSSLNGYVAIEFRPPRWNGPADTFVYEWPADPMIVSMLLTSARAGGLTLNPQIRERIGGAVSDFLALQRHGHWDDFLMARNGEWRGVPPNTIQYHRALLDYVQWQAQTLEMLFRHESHSVHGTSDPAAGVFSQPPGNGQAVPEGRLGGSA